HIESPGLPILMRGRAGYNEDEEASLSRPTVRDGLQVRTAAALFSHSRASLGFANGGRPARRFDGVLVSECTVAAATGFAMPSMIAVLPARLMNLPKKSYRLRTEQVSCSSPIALLWQIHQSRRQNRNH